MNLRKKPMALGMTIGILGSTAVGILVNIITGDGAVWAWATPVGVAVGAALGAGWDREGRDE